MLFYQLFRTVYTPQPQILILLQLATADRLHSLLALSPSTITFHPYSHIRILKRKALIEIRCDGRTRSQSITNH